LANLAKVKAKRKTFVAREDLLAHLAEIAERKGYSLYALVNDIFELAIRADDAGLNLKSFLDDCMAVKRAKDAGFILCLERLCYVMADMAYERSKSRVIKEWFDAGAWFAKRYIIGGGNDGWEEFIMDLKTLFWNVYEFEVDRKGDVVNIRVLSPKFTEAYTRLLEAFLDGCLNALGYKISFKEVYRGRIFIEAKKVGENAEGQ